MIGRYDCCQSPLFHTIRAHENLAENLREAFTRRAADNMPA